MTDLASPPDLETAGASIIFVLLLAAFALHRRKARRTIRVGLARMRYGEGLRAGQADRSREWWPGQPLCAECPYNEGTDDYFIWLEGYLDASHLVMPSLPISGLIS